MTKIYEDKYTVGINANVPCKIISKVHPQEKYLIKSYFIKLVDSGAFMYLKILTKGQKKLTHEYLLDEYFNEL